MDKILKNTSTLFFCITLIFATAVTLTGAAQKSVSPVDASMRASMARHIVETGVLFPPQYDGEVLLDHPPGYIWSIALSFKIFGVNDFAAQLPGRLSAFFCLLVIWLTARRMGLAPPAAFFAVLILGATRDFILIAMQGGIEPLLSLWCWLGFYFLLPEKITNRLPQDRFAYGRTALAALCVVLAAFTKGPPALWPFIFSLTLISFYGAGFLRKITHLSVFLSTLALLSAVWAWYIIASGDLWYWKWYWNDQVLGSALRGRNMQLESDYGYFIRVIARDYWPWLPLLLFAVVLQIRIFFRWALPSAAILALLFAGGFFAGFSIVKWKFWYYIAPCFPGFALFIAATLENNAVFRKVFHAIRLEKTVLVASLVWILLLSIFPLQLSRNAMPEIQAFKEVLRYSAFKTPVWFVNHPGDHNMYATSGNWYFNRIVKKVGDVKAWEKSLVRPAWIITGAENFKTCKEKWCSDATFSQTTGISTLVFVPAISSRSSAH